MPRQTIAKTDKPKKWSPALFQSLKPRPQRYVMPDPQTPGLYVRVSPSGKKTFTIVARDPRGTQIWREVDGAILGDPLDDVRAKAREGIRRLKAGLVPFPPPPQRPETFGAVVANYLDLHVQGNGLDRGPLRSAPEIERCLNKYILPHWRDREFEDIRRSDVTPLLDGIVKRHGARQADYVLAIVRGIMNWQATRLDDYVSPIVRRMSRTDPDERKRKRILDDDELRAIWPHLTGTFGALVKLLLLTGQRREKVVAMRWSDISDDGVWSIPSEDREKGNAGDLTLPPQALDVIRAQREVAAGSQYIFAGRRQGKIADIEPNRQEEKMAAKQATTYAPFNGFSKSKAALDQRTGIEGWVLHDLRRSARSLMSRAGVPSDIAERVLGHAIAGVEGVYNRYEYFQEKNEALAALGALVERILDPQDDVVELSGRA